MDIKTLNTFITAVQLGSFTRAGEKLGYSQPAVSAQIRQLEQELQVRLFDRIHHSIALTSEGKTVYAYACEICQKEDELQNAVHASGPVHGLVRIGMSDSMCSWLMEGQFAAMRAQYPGITLRIIPQSTEGILQLLDQNEVDLAYTLDRHVYSRDYVIAQEERVGMHFVAAPQSMPAVQGVLSMEQLVELPCILTERAMSYRRLLDQQLAQHSLQIDPILEIGNTNLICRLVEQGLGVAFLPDYVTEPAVQQGRICRFAVTGLSFEIWKQLLYHRGKSLTAPIRTVMSFLHGSAAHARKEPAQHK